MPGTEIEELTRHGRFLRALARGLVSDEHLAEDALQDTCLAALDYGHDGVRAPRGWMRAILRNTIARQGRREAQRAGREARRARPEAQPATVDLAERRQIMRLVSSAVLNLEEPYRTSVLLRFYDDLPPRKIARRMSVPVETVRSRIRRGLAQVRKTLDRAAGHGDWRWALPGVLACGANMPFAGSAAVGGKAGSFLVVGSKLKVALCSGLALLLASAVFVLSHSEDTETSPSLQGIAGPSETGSSAPGGEIGKPGGDVIGTLPFTESSANDTPQVASLSLSVLDAAGDPAKKARLVVLPENGAPSGFETDETGRASVPASGGTSELILITDGAYPHVEPHVALHPGQLAVRLRGTHVIGGRVVIAGERPLMPLVLELKGDLGFSKGAAIAACLDAETPILGVHRWKVTTNPQGEFRFHGFPPDWSGTLTVPEAFRIVGRDSTRPGLHIEAPTDGLVLELAPVPFLSGRVVRPGTGKPVPHAELKGNYFTSRYSYGHEATADDAGRFRIPLKPTNLHRLELVFADENGQARRVLDFRKELDRDRDLGDVPLAALREVVFEVIDRSGKRIPKSVAISNTGTRFRASDADGMMRLGLSAEDKVLRVAALGHADRLVEIPIAAHHLDPVVLDSDTALEIKIVDPSGQPARGFEIAIHSTEYLYRFVGNNRDRARMEGVYSMVGARRETTTGSWGNKVTTSFHPGSSGRALICGVRAPADLRIVLRDALETKVEEKILRTSPGTTHEVIFELPHMPGRLLGRVVDAAGRPIVGARIYRSARGLGYTATKTDGEGTFEVGPLQTERFDFSIAHKGYAPRSFRDHELSGSNTVETFVLTPGHRVTVTVKDAAGKQLRPGDMSARFSGRMLKIGRPDSDGNFLFEDLPPDKVLFKTSLSGQSYSLEHQGRHPQAHLVVPTHGRVEFLAPRDGPAQLWGRAIFKRSASDGQSITVPLSARTGSALVDVLPGTYRVTLSVREQGSKQILSLVFPGEVTVSAGQTTALDVSAAVPAEAGASSK